MPLLPGRDGAEVPPVGATGRRGTDKLWADRTETDSALALAVRVPAGVVDLDVDSHGARAGQAEESLASLGPLPPTMRSTSRGGHATSGQYFYQWPRSMGTMPARLKRLPGIDVLHQGCGFSRTWPSWSTKIDEPYHLYWGAPGDGGSCAALERPVAVADLAELPSTAVARLLKAESAPLPAALAWAGAARSSVAQAREIVDRLGLVRTGRGWASMSPGDEYVYPPSESGSRSALRRDDGWWHIYSNTVADVLGILDESPFARGFDDQALLDALDASDNVPPPGELPDWAAHVCRCPECLKYL